MPKDGSDEVPAGRMDHSFALLVGSTLRMRDFNKIFVIALPRCATVSICDALGILGISTAHLGRIHGEQTIEHNNPQRLMRIHAQICRNDFELDVLRECRGLADYPACCRDVFPRLDEQYPGSLFINVQRKADVARWLQSVERQFIGLQLIKQRQQATDEERRLMEVMMIFREMTFGQTAVDATAYLRAYESYQTYVNTYFRGREHCLLNVADIGALERQGFQYLAKFLDCPVPARPFPKSNRHSRLPEQAFARALKEGLIQSQTGIVPVVEPHACVLPPAC